MTPRLAILFLLVAFYFDDARAQDAKPPPAAPPISTITIGKTPGDVEYGVWGVIGEKPAPLLFVLAGTIDSTLSSADFAFSPPVGADLFYYDE